MAAFVLLSSLTPELPTVLNGVRLLSEVLMLRREARESAAAEAAAAASASRVQAMDDDMDFDSTMPYMAAVQASESFANESDRPLCVGALLF